MLSLPSGLTVFSLHTLTQTCSYRGYGPSKGSPTEAGLKLDAEAVMELCSQFEDIDRSRIFVFGRSLGGAVAIDIVSKHQDKVDIRLHNASGERTLVQIAGLIVENTFTSIADMVPCVLPFLRPLMRLKLYGNVPTFSNLRHALRVSYLLLRNKWSNKDTIQKITKTPILFLASGRVRLFSTRRDLWTV